MPGSFLVRDYQHGVQIESTINTSPGALAGTDVFKSQTQFPFKRILARMDRTKDKDNGQASVITTQPGREKCSWEVTGNVIPSGNAATPTAADMGPFFEGHFGTATTCTAHTTTTVGSTTTSIVLTVGGGAASGIPTGGGVLVAIDVDATFGVEVRFVSARATDTLTVTPALSAAPATGRAVYVPPVTYKYNEAVMKTLHIWEHLDGDNFRHKAGGCIPRNLELTLDGGSETPEAMVTVGGEGYPIATHSTSIPTPTVAGQPLNPTEAKVFISTSGKLCLIDASLKGDNGVELRESDFCSLTPNGVKRTANDGRYSVEMSIKFLLYTGGALDVEDIFDAAASLTSYPVIVQWGIVPGKMIAWYCPKWIPDGEVGEQEGEAAISLTGRVYGTSGDDEVYLAIF